MRQRCLSAIIRAVTACICCASCARAEPVTVFGILDTYLSHVQASGAGSLTRMDPSGLLASRIAVRGGDDLGDGYRSSFLLEAGIAGDDGSMADANRLWNRQAWLALDGPQGQLRIGRQNTPQFVMNGKFDAFISSTQASGWNNMFGAVPRVDNAVAYLSPSMAGLTLQAMVARGASGSALPAAQTAANQSLHLAAEYTHGRCYLGTNYEDLKTTTLPSVARRVAMGGSCAASETLTLYAAVAHEMRSDDSLRTMLYTTSARYRITAQGALSLGWTTLHDELSGAGHGGAHQLGTMYLYALSKRTSLYGTLSRLVQQGLRRNFTLQGDTVTAPAPPGAELPGAILHGIQLGMVHTF